MADYEYITRYTSPNRTRAAIVPLVYGRRRKITAITIHWWDDPARRPSFGGVIDWLCRKGGSSSAHYVIEAGRVACIVNPKDAAWHAGNRVGNATTIGLELNPRCSDGDYETAAQVIRELRETYGDLPLVPHRKWKHTSCPGNYDLGRLDLLARGLPAPVSGGGGGGRTVPVTKPEAAQTQRHRTGHVGPYAVAADGVFGKYTKLALQHRLRELGYRGHAVDGDFGHYSVRSMQQWLRKRGQNGHAIDGDFGRYTITSLQAHLRAIGYTGHAIDGDFGRYTVTSLQLALIDGKVR